MATTRRRFFSLLLLAVRPPKPVPAAITPAYLRGVRAAEADIRAYTPRPKIRAIWSGGGRLFVVHDRAIGAVEYRED
jgi:hypothetical protein